MFVIFDLDGTLADIEHRRHFIAPGGKRDWQAFFAACTDDLPIFPVIEIAQSLDRSGDHRVEIWSGRSDEVRQETAVWLDGVGLGHLPLKMRPAGDYTPDDQLKEQWLKGEDDKPDFVFDDRNKVVAMWRRHGIVCGQVAPGDF